MGLGSNRPFKGLELLADFPGEMFSRKTALWDRLFEPFCKVMDSQIRGETVLGKHEVFREYADIVRWPIRKLEYAFVLDRARPSLEKGEHPKVLDAGCGVTPFPHLLSMMGATVEAVDFDEELIEVLKAAKVNDLYGFPVHHQWMDLRQLAFLDATFDLVTCVSVLEHLDDGDERLVLDEIVRVLKPTGKALLTVDVKEGNAHPAGDGERRHDEPFSWRSLHRLLAPHAQLLQGGLDRFKTLKEELRHDTVERFWASHWSPESTWRGNRGYVALGIVLSNTRVDGQTGRPLAARSQSDGPGNEARPHGKRNDADRTAILLKSQIRRSIELERALAEKEQVIRELDQALQRERTTIDPFQFLSKVWQRLAKKARGAGR